jgi:L-fuconolactonase
MKAEKKSLTSSDERVRAFSENPSFGNLVAGPNLRWLSLHSETAIDAGRPIVDAHHHLWDMPRAPYLDNQLLVDLQSGHKVIGTVFVQCSEGYLQNGPPALRPVGETQFVNTVIDKCAEKGFPSACAGIVGYADLRLGAAVELALHAHTEVGRGRFRGIRQSAVWDESKEVCATISAPPEKLLSDSKFREGFGRLAPCGLSFDAWVYHHQLPEVADLARAFPETRIIINHTGGPIGMGAYANRRREVFDQWRKGLAEAARCSEVFVKLGGLGMPLSGFAFHDRAEPPTSDELARLWSPYFDACIELFGTNRCMFESNFPVDKQSFSYCVLWNAYKKIASGYSPSEKAQLFDDTATRAYRLGELS